MANKHEGKWKRIKIVVTPRPGPIEVTHYKIIQAPPASRRSLPIAPRAPTPSSDRPTFLQPTHRWRGKKYCVIGGTVYKINAADTRIVAVSESEAMQVLAEGQLLDK